MDNRSLTQEYLARVTTNGLKSRELIGRLPESEQLKAFYKGTFLSRPLFLGHAERVQVYSDLENLLTALSSLPDRLFGGDFAAFARAVGMSELQVSAVMRGRGAAMTRQARADLYREGNGFKLLELNMGSTIGGMDNADMVRGMLEHPVLADFARTHRLGYVDTLREQVNDILVESGFKHGDHPVVALTEWPTAFDEELPFMKLLCGRWRELGLDAHPCHVGQLTARHGRVWLGNRPVDIVVRTFLVSDLLESPDGSALADPILDAADRGEVKVFTPLDTAAYASKGALAMLSDERTRHLFTPEELASLDRILPWTRMARPGMVTLETGERVDLVEYATAHRHDLVVKPTLLSAGRGVVLGWAENLTTDEWREQLTAALDGPYVVQRRIRPTAELFPDENGELRPWNVLWGMFTVVNGYGGTNARAIPAAAGDVVMNGSNGAYSGPALVELSPPPASVGTDTMVIPALVPGRPGGVGSRVATASGRAAVAMADQSPNNAETATERGSTVVSNEVVEKVAAIAAREIPGVYDLGGGVAQVFSAGRERIRLGEPDGEQGVSVRLDGRSARVKVALVIEYGSVVHTVTHQVRAAVIAAIESMLGLAVAAVDIVVDDVHVTKGGPTGQHVA